jgi:hypothetical protein
MFLNRLILIIVVLMLYTFVLFYSTMLIIASNHPLI